MEGELIVAVGLICKTKEGVIAEELSVNGKILEAPTVIEAQRGVLDFYADNKNSKLMVKFEKATDGIKFIVHGIANTKAKRDYFNYRPRWKDRIHAEIINRDKF